jgi:hypothetical protein
MSQSYLESLDSDKSSFTSGSLRASDLDTIGSKSDQADYSERHSLFLGRALEE